MVNDRDVAPRHNLGIGAVVVPVYKRADVREKGLVSNEQVSKVSGLAYNPAVEARIITPKDAERVQSKNSHHDHLLQDTAKKLAVRLRRE